MFKMMSDTRTELLGRSLFLLVVLLVLVPDGEADAHHGAAAHFDPDDVVSAAGAAPRPKYLDNGQPNLSGAWVSPSGGGTGNVNNGPPEPSAAGLAASEEFNFRDVLIVDTVGLLPRALIPRAEVMISGQTHILERFEYDEAERVLIRHYTVTDPLYLEKPYSGVNVSDIAAQQYRRSIVWI